MNPWEVAVKGGGKIDYDKLIEKFGCQRLDSSLVRRVERLTSRPAHVFLRRGVFFAHRYKAVARRLSPLVDCPRISLSLSPFYPSITPLTFLTSSHVHRNILCHFTPFIWLFSMRIVMIMYKVVLIHYYLEIWRRFWTFTSEGRSFTCTQAGDHLQKHCIWGISSPSCSQSKFQFRDATPHPRNKFL